MLMTRLCAVFLLTVLLFPYLFYVAGHVFVHQHPLFFAEEGLKGPAAVGTVDGIVFRP